jgi:hypothetical protein
MTWPLQPIGPTPPGTPRIDPLERAGKTDRRRERRPDDDERRERERKQPEAPATPDADGHIDVLA